jgi:hypothetical protein
MKPILPYPGEIKELKFKKSGFKSSLNIIESGD